jgi:hypothetical protein
MTLPKKNLRKGMLRLWIAASVVWLVGWAAYVFKTCEFQNVQWYCYTGFGEWMSPITYLTFWDYASLIATGMSFPLVALVLGAGTWWVINGFKSLEN